MRRYPQVLLNIQVARPEGPRRSRRGVGGRSPGRGRARRRGRVLVRASGTEPLVRVMVEAETGDEAAAHAEELADAVRASLGGS